MKQHPTVVYIVSDIQKSVFFEKTASTLLENKVHVEFILINCKNSAFSHYLNSIGAVQHLITCKKIAFSFSAIRSCFHILKKIKPTHVHCHLGLANWIGLWAAFLARVPNRFYTRHSGKPTQHIRKEFWIDRIQNKLATRIIAISEVTRKLLLEQGVTDKKIHILHHGFDLDRMVEKNEENIRLLQAKYNPAAKKPVIGVVARWIELKGIQYIIPAFQRVLKDYPNAQLLLFNAAENTVYSKHIRSLLDELPEGSYQTVVFEPDVFHLYYLFDVFVQASFDSEAEAFGQTYIEALATGTPSVFTLSGVALEFIEDKKNAWVAPFQNAEAIADGIIHLLNNSTLAQELAKQGKKDVQEKFSWKIYSQHLIALYHG